ncbi:MAG: 4Fe-4S binding protein, partial [Burkholderiales bacterium]
MTRLQPITEQPPRAAVDLLRWPVIGRFLRWKHARTTLQLFALLAAAAIVLHGLFGPQVAPRNLATVLTWVHYRGLLVVALLAAGNLFCTGCPFVLVRDVARRGHAPGWRWPRWLRTKWIGLALFAGVLFAYELFDLWSLPRATAWLVLGYFGAALAIDLVFQGAAFCKYLCPIGQFNFAASTLSPLEVTVKNRNVCGACRTSDCIKGRRAADMPAVVSQRGCELGLFLPSKVGNLDCTFCLDCVQACPHDNVAIAARLPGAELVEGSRRSGIGRLATRPDIAALAVLFAFGGLLNALAMTGPVYDLERWLARTLSVTSEWPVLALLFIASLVVIPALALSAASTATRLLTGAGSVRTGIVRYAAALVPFGFGVWLAHYGFHLLTGVLTIVPVVQSAAIDALGWPALGDPLWRLAGMRPGAVFPIQLGFLVLGTMGTIAVAYGISEREHPARPGAATVPWAIVVVAM